ncbi:MAG: META domain-containing protein [Chitinophagaceae bacterium]
MDKKNVVSCVLSLFALGIVSCDSISKLTNSIAKKTPPSPPVAHPTNVNHLNGQWRLTYVTGPRITFDGLYPDKKPVMRLDTISRHASGNTGCNSFNGSFVLQQDSIHFGQMATTMVSCPDGGQGETLFLGMLDKVSHYRVVKDTLWLRFRKIDAMRFVRDTTTIK